jgi:hypothetical protein
MRQLQRIHTQGLICQAALVFAAFGLARQLRWRRRRQSGGSHVLRTRQEGDAAEVGHTAIRCRPVTARLTRSSVVGSEIAAGRTRRASIASADPAPATRPATHWRVAATRLSAATAPSASCLLRASPLEGPRCRRQWAGGSLTRSVLFRRNGTIVAVQQVGELLTL